MKTVTNTGVVVY